MSPAGWLSAALLFAFGSALLSVATGRFLRTRRRSYTEDRTDDWSGFAVYPERKPPEAVPEPTSVEIEASEQAPEPAIVVAEPESAVVEPDHPARKLYRDVRTGRFVSPELEPHLVAVIDGEGKGVLRITTVDPASMPEARSAFGEGQPINIVSTGDDAP